MTSTTPETQIQDDDDDVQFDFLPNFRRIRGTRIYRSSGPDSLNVSDISKLKRLGIKTIIDFRSPGTFEKDLMKEKLVDSYYRPYTTHFRSDGSYTFRPQKLVPNKDVQTEGASYQGNHYYVSLIDKEFAVGVGRLVPWYKKLWLVFWAILFYGFGVDRLIREVSTCALNPIGIVGMYNHFIADSRNRIAASLEMIGNPDNLPVVICCRHGKDRTGVLSALLNGVMGMDRTEIVQDYAKTKENLAAIQDSLDEYDDYFGFTHEFATAEPETMEKMLDFTEQRYGSIIQYFNHIGFKGEKLETFKNNISIR